jgi:hypothetical protein
MIKKSESRLFTEGSVDGFLQHRAAQMLREVDAIPAHSLLDASGDGACDALITKYAINLPVLDSSPDKIRRSNPAEVPLQADDYGRRLTVRGIRYQFYVPFQGDPSLFRFHGSSFPMTPPRASVDSRKNEIVILMDTYEEDAQGIDDALKAELRLIQGFLDGLAPVVAAYNQKLGTEAVSTIEARRATLGSAQAVSSKLPYRPR